jgi:hypothetical protein
VVARDSHTHKQDSHHTWHMERESGEHRHLEERIHNPDMKDSQEKAGSPAFVEDSQQMEDRVDGLVPEVGSLVSDRKVDTQDMEDREDMQSEREAPLMNLKAMSLRHVHDG